MPSMGTKLRNLKKSRIPGSSVQEFLNINNPTGARLHNNECTEKANQGSGKQEQ
jgi:hypothetical protein